MTAGTGPGRYIDAQPTVRRRVLRADLDFRRLPHAVRRRVGQPVHLVGDQPGTHKLLPRADNDGIVLRIQLRDIDRLARRDAEPPPLADRVVHDPGVRAEQAAPRVADLAGPLGFRPPGSDQRFVIIVRDETDFLALRLVVHLQPEVGRDPPHLGLVFDLPQREQAARQVFTRDTEQRVRLILVWIAGTRQE